MIHDTQLSASSAWLDIVFNNILLFYGMRIIRLRDLLQRCLGDFALLKHRSREMGVLHGFTTRFNRASEVSHHWKHHNREMVRLHEFTTRFNHASGILHH